MSNFDFIAPVYDKLAYLVFGQSLRKAQAYFLATIPVDASVLILGGGTGWLLEQVLNKCAPKQVVYLEASTRMLALTQRRMRSHPLVGRVRFRHGTQQNIYVDECFDVVLTPFVLDLFSEQHLRQEVLSTLHQAMPPQGLLLATDFDHPKTIGQRWMLGLMYRFFRITTNIEASYLPNWPQLITEAGFTPHEQAFFRNGQLRTGCWRA